MTAFNVPRVDYKTPLVEPGTGLLTRYGYDLVNALINRTGGTADKVDAAHALATAAVPQGTEVVGVGGLQTGGPLGGNVGVTFYVVKAAVAALPSVKLTEGDWAYALDGRKPGEGGGAGTGVPCFWSAGAWIAVTSGAAVTA